MPDSAVYPVLGTMTMGIQGQVKPDAAAEIIKSFCEAACAASPKGVMIDTARVYQASTPEGDTETILGHIFSANPALREKVHIATKVNHGMPPHRSLSKQSVIEQCNTCLSKLQLSCIDLLYLHSPDIKTDLEDTLSGIDELHKQGKIKEFGLSNYPAWAVVDIWHRCKARGIVLPTVYQGMYNAITRDMERELVPVARQFGLRLMMYNPLAGGLLSGRYTSVDDVANASEGRFSKEFGAGKMYQDRYSKEAILEGLNALKAACDAEGILLPDAALRWTLHHSLLHSGDGVIFGVSKVSQLSSNLAAWSAGPLPSSVVEACEAAWEAARPACEPYFRGFGAKAGGIELFLELLSKRSKL